MRYEEMSIILFYCDFKINSWHLSAIFNMKISNKYNGKYANYVYLCSCMIIRNVLTMVFVNYKLTTLPIFRNVLWNNSNFTQNRLFQVGGHFVFGHILKCPTLTKFQFSVWSSAMPKETESINKKIISTKRGLA